MSRIGKKLIKIPEGVEIKNEDNLVIVKGPKGELKKELDPRIEVKVEDGKCFVKPIKNRKELSPIWGLFRSLIEGMVTGVSEGFEKKLEFEGVGYKAEVKGKKLVLQMGFSHPVEVEPPEGIEFSVDKNTITVKGIDKQAVGQISAKIREVRPPEPYKGKGVHYLGQYVRRKAGKSAAKK